ncbi:MAG: hypothetical protein Q7J11_01275 [Candidatus Roizmanbacteria bacterium]|nr:hypothetical protein [Candidatus Roizmanbacteria bacterium]
MKIVFVDYDTGLYYNGSIISMSSNSVNENGLRIGLFRVAHFGRGTSTKFTLVVPDVYTTTDGIRHRKYIPEILASSGVLSLVAAGVLHFAR